LKGETTKQFFGHHFAFFSLFLISRSTRTPRRIASSSCGILPHSKKRAAGCRYYFGGSSLTLDPPYGSLG
jgi:hypothetical protein